jgi:hypothetical protein
VAPRPITIQTAKRIITAIREKWPSNTDIAGFNADILLTDSKGNTMRIQMVGVPPGDLTSLRMNDHPVIAYTQDGNSGYVSPTSFTN